MRILVIGCKGQLGRELCLKGRWTGLNIAPLDRPRFDVTEASNVKEAIDSSRAHLVINVSAYTAVGKAESEPGRAFAVNRDGPALLASSCARLGIPLIHVSTDYVFAGDKAEPYRESDPVCPLGVYGRSKAEGETKVREQLPEHIILRTAWLYGIHGNNFVKSMLKLGRERVRLKVVDDQRGCPTYTADLADALLVITRQFEEEKRDLSWGTYHYCGQGVTTWHGLAKKVFEIAGRFEYLKVRQVDPITSRECPTPAKRPINSVLDCSLLEKTFGINRKPWDESLALMLDRYYKNKKPS